MYETVWCSNILSEIFFFLLNHYQIKLNPLYYQTFNERLKQKVDITNKLCTLATLNKMVMLLHMCIITRRKNT